MITGIDVGCNSYFCMIEFEKLLAARFPVIGFRTFWERDFWEPFQINAEAFQNVCAA